MADSKKPKFGGIKFRDNYESFEEFKAELENTHVFKDIPHKERTAELRKAYKYATDGNVSNKPKGGGKANAGKGK